METYARKCSITSKGMNEGYIIWDGELYISDHLLLLDWIRITFCNEINVYQMSDRELIEWCYNENHLYYTEWGDDDHMYQEIDGKLIEIEE